jgi:hypothetical protein
MALEEVFRRAGAAAFRALLFSFLARGLVGRFRRALPFGVPAAAVFRRPPLLAFAAREPAPPFLPDGVFLSPFFVPLFFAIAVFVSGCSRTPEPFSWLTNRPK